MSILRNLSESVGHHDNDVSSSLLASNDGINSNNIGLAFAITLIAGLSTAIGGAIVFFPRLVADDNSRLRKKIMSAGLSMAAGTVTFLALIDLFPESVEFFNNGERHDDNNLAFLWATLCFFGGVVSMFGLSWIVHRIHPDSHSHDVDDALASKYNGSEMPQEIAANERAYPDNNNTNSDSSSSSSSDNADVEDKLEDISLDTNNNDIEHGKEISSTSLSIDSANRSLLSTGITIGIALFSHNFPEGIIVFIGTVYDPTLGIALAIGIILHNIPEGVAVSLPIYFADNRKRCQAFLASLLTGLSQPIAGLVAYGIFLNSSFSTQSFGVMFGIAAGTLIYIAIKNLLPTAYKYDPQDKLTTVFFFVGMILIAISLVTLESTGNHSHSTGSHGDHQSTLGADVESHHDNNHSH